MTHRKLLYKNPEVDLKNKYPKLRELGIIIALGGLTILFYAFKDFKPAYRLEKLPDISITIEEIPPTDPYKKPPPPDTPPLPELTEDPDIPQYEPTWSSEIDFGNTDINIPKFGEEEPEVPFAELSEKPKIEKRVVPAYPEIARKVGITGTVVIQVLVNARGEVEEPRVISGNIMLIDAALEAVVQWKFSPVQRERPVKVRMTIPVRFKLRN